MTKQEEQIQKLESEIKSTDKEIKALTVKLSGCKDPAQAFNIRNWINSLHDLNNTRAKLKFEYERSQALNHALETTKI